MTDQQFDGDEKKVPLLALPRGWFIGTYHLGDYMGRWLFETPWGSLRLHHILRSDKGRDMHDHPMDFTTFILWGSYIEVTPIPDDIWQRLGQDPDYAILPIRSENAALYDSWQHFVTTGQESIRRCLYRDELHTFWPRWSCRKVMGPDLHRLVLTQPAWTLVLAGPKYRAWGFQTEDGWVPRDQAKAEWNFKWLREGTEGVPPAPPTPAPDPDAPPVTPGLVFAALVDLIGYGIYAVILVHFCGDPSWSQTTKILVIWFTIVFAVSYRTFLKRAKGVR